VKYAKRPFDRQHRSSQLKFETPKEAQRLNLQDDDFETTPGAEIRLPTEFETAEA
jgi:hypothetical protein